MQAHLSTMHDEMWYVIKDGPIKIMKVKTTTRGDLDAPHMFEKPKVEYTFDDRKRVNIDNVAQAIQHKTLDKMMFNKIKSCKTVKEIWGKLTMICKRTDQI